MLYPTVGFERSLAALVRRLDIPGHRIFDLLIALIENENGTRELWSHDTGLLTVPGLRVCDPLARC